MKKKLMLVFVFCLSLSSRVVYCSQQLGYAGQLKNWIAAKVHYYFGPKPHLGRTFVETAGSHRNALAVGVLGVADYYNSPAILLGLPFILLVAELPIAIIGATVSHIGDILIDYHNQRIEREDAVQRIEADLVVLLNKDTIWPTRSSKINALIKKDEFLDYIHDEDSVVNEASNRLLKKLNEAPYSASEQKREELINAYISKLKVDIAHLPLREQIEALENRQTESRDIFQATGYLSLLKRLQNKLEVEENLTPEQRKIWNDKRVQLPAMTPEQIKQFKKRKQELEQETQEAKKSAERLKRLQGLKSDRQTMNK